MSQHELTRIIQQAVLTSSRPAREIAQEVGKPYPTLMREINPDDNGAKVGVDGLIPLMRATDSIQPLTHLANAMGFLLVPHQLDIKDSGQATLMALDLMDGFGKYAKALKTALRSGDMDERVILDVEKHGHEAMTAIMTMIHHLRKKAAQAKAERESSPVPDLAMVG